jgi:hypothetical protein
VPLPLVAVEPVVVGLSLRTLAPLAAGRLLTPTVAAGALRPAVSHGLGAIAGGRLRARTREVAWLTTVLTYVSYALVGTVIAEQWTFYIPPY